MPSFSEVMEVRSVAQALSMIGVDAEWIVLLLTLLGLAIVGGKGAIWTYQGVRIPVSAAWRWWFPEPPPPPEPDPLVKAILVQLQSDDAVYEQSKPEATKDKDTKAGLLQAGNLHVTRGTSGIVSALECKGQDEWSNLTVPERIEVGKAVNDAINRVEECKRLAAREASLLRVTHGKGRM